MINSSNWVLKLSLIAMLSWLAFSSPAAAQSSIFAQPGPDSAMIVGIPGYEARNLYEVEFIEINDRLIADRNVLWLKPGKYTLTVRMFIRNPPGLRTRSSRRGEPGYNKIEIVAEAGKRYHILAKYDETQRLAPYRTILYKVEDVEDKED